MSRGLLYRCIIGHSRSSGKGWSQLTHSPDPEKPGYAVCGAGTDWDKTRIVDKALLRCQNCRKRLGLWKHGTQGGGPVLDPKRMRRAHETAMPVDERTKELWATMGAPLRERKPGAVRCLRCDVPFESPDKTTVRICPLCRAAWESSRSREEYEDLRA